MKNNLVPFRYWFAGEMVPYLINTLKRAYLQRPIWFYMGSINYYDTMLNRAPRLILYVVFLCLLGRHGFAQNLTKSPYSIIGVGESHYYGSAYLSAMGQVSQG